MRRPDHERVAVISPDGHLAWYPLTETAGVQAIVSCQQ